MKLFSVAALLAVVVSTVTAVIVNTPASAVQCQPLLITWDPQGSAGPFFLSVVPGASPSSPALYSWSNLTGTSFTWVVAQPAGTSLGLLLRDQTGATSQSAPFTVQAGSTTDCLGSSGSIPPSSSLVPSSLPPSNSTSISKPPLTPSTTSTTRPPSVSPLSTIRPSLASSSSSSRTPGSTPTTQSGSTSGNGGVLSNAVNFCAAGFLAILVGAVLA